LLKGVHERRRLKKEQKNEKGVYLDYLRFKKKQ
jgi:hypothetical protein